MAAQYVLPQYMRKTVWGEKKPLKCSHSSNWRSKTQQVYVVSSQHAVMCTVCIRFTSFSCKSTWRLCFWRQQLFQMNLSTEQNCWNKPCCLQSISQVCQSYFSVYSEFVDKLSLSCTNDLPICHYTWSITGEKHQNYEYFSVFSCSMNGFAINSSSSALAYFWKDCNTYGDDVGAGKLSRPSAGLCILFSTYCFEVLVGAPLNLWLVCHILRKRQIFSDTLVEYSNTACTGKKVP